MGRGLRRAVAEFARDLVGQQAGPLLDMPDKKARYDIEEAKSVGVG